MNSQKESREEARDGQDFNRRTDLGDYRQKEAMSAGYLWIDITLLRLLYWSLPIEYFGISRCGDNIETVIYGQL